MAFNGDPTSWGWYPSVQQPCLPFSPLNYMSGAMPFQFGYPLAQPPFVPYQTLPLFSLTHSIADYMAEYPVLPPANMHFSRPVLQATRTIAPSKRPKPSRKDVLAESLAARARRAPLPADSNMGPMLPEWTTRLADYDPEGETSDQRPTRQRTHAEFAFRKTKKGSFNDDGSIRAHKATKISKVVETKVTDAKVNYTTFQDFNFDRNLKPRPNPIPPETTLWNDGIPRSAISADNVNLAFYIPKMFTDDWTHNLTDYLNNFGRYRSRPHFKMKAGDTAIYQERLGELAGGLACVRGWNAIGSKRIAEKFKVAAEMVQTAEAHANATDLLASLSIVSHHVNGFLYHADRDHFKDAQKLRTVACNTLAAQRAMGAIDPLIYEGREVLFNRVSGEHADIQDPPFGWAILTAFGNNTPVILKLPQLNLHMSFGPGDMIAIRGRILRHSTTLWESGQRIVIPHFTHTASWTTFAQQGALSRCATS